MRRHTRFVHTFLVCCVLAIGSASTGAWLGRWHWFGDILALGVAVYRLLALLLLLVFLYQRTWRRVAVACGILLLTSYQIMSYPHVAPEPQPAIERSLRLLVYNIYHQNEDLDAVVDLINQTNPDVIFFMEYSYAIQQHIEASFAAYPYRLIQPSRLTMGLALFSRVPIETAEVYRNEATRIPVYHVQMQLAGQSVSFVGGHPWPPWPQWGALHRSQMLEIIRVARNASPPLIVAGDFNAVPWAYTMRHLATSAEVRPIWHDSVLPGTWQLIPGVGLAIDHVLISTEWQVLAQQYGSPGDSDHVPLIVDLQLR